MRSNLYIFSWFFLGKTRKGGDLGKISAGTDGLTRRSAQDNDLSVIPTDGVFLIRNTIKLLDGSVDKS